MSLSLALNNALSGLRVNQSALAITSTNLANLNNPNYSRKVLVQETQVIAGIGAGVTADTIQRSVNTLLQRDFREENTRLSGIKTENDYLSRIQQMFGTVANKNALGDLVNKFATSLENIGNNPEISSNHFSAVNDANQLASRIRDMANTVQQERIRADAEISQALQDMKVQMGIIAEINGTIPGQKAQGLPTGDLEDKRDQAISSLAQYVDIQYFQTDRGQINVLTGSGNTLVSGAYTAELSFRQTTYITANETYPTALDGIHFNAGGNPTTANDITAGLTGGKLAALFEARDVTLPSVTNQLDLMSAKLRDAVNLAHNRGANTPLGKGTAASDPATLLSSRSFANTAQAMTLSDDVNMVLLDANGVMVGGMGTIVAGATTPAAVQGQINAFLGANGTAQFDANGRLEIKLNSNVRFAMKDAGTVANQGDSVVQYDANLDGTTENYSGFSNFFGLNDFYVTPELTAATPAVAGQGLQNGISTSFRVRSDIVADPSTISRGKMTGTPPVLQLGSGNNEVALELAAAFEKNEVFDSITNGPSRSTTTLAGYAGVMLSYSATTAQASNNALQFQSTLTGDLQVKMQNESGVNMDEELANMVVFQNAYNAAARVIQITGEMFDTVIELA
ncbi:flagellar hook-associated protein FlgK [Kiloniella laminariae]|uniref:Flagellar hook-associated protein 1 n=1 Tax=Kiloniella laminariae TaxID=454162 RepID=A0ABT4LJG3_9PROT|nr:flagellar hook-associated protein FlgK [Kiloniella laminariae]MCZ4280501.1 flagellar hook-associated protein FlgK [Kiloniella laminariae]